MPTYIHFVRHAQGFHNLSIANQQIPDPDLTALGKEQCAALNKRFPFHDRITHLVASPLRRTIYTCLLSFGGVVGRGHKIIALPDIQEISLLPCDTGSDPEKLAAEFDPAQVDLGLVGDGWTRKEVDLAGLEERAKRARIWLRQLGSQTTDGDAHIVAVTHGGFVHFLTQDWDGIDPDRVTGWDNAEYRSYEFVDPSGQDSAARLQETQASWRKRRGSTKGPTEAEQRELRSAVQERIRQEFEVDQEAGQD